MLLSEGERVKKTRKIYTAFELNTVDEVNNISADLVVLDGKTYEIFITKEYNMGCLDHFKSIAIKVDL